MFYKAFTLNRLSSIQILNKLVMFSMYHLQVYASQKVKMLTLKFSIMIDWCKEHGFQKLRTHKTSMACWALKDAELLYEEYGTRCFYIWSSLTKSLANGLLNRKSSVCSKGETKSKSKSSRSANSIKTNCKSIIELTLDQTSGMLVVKKSIEEHNHEVVTHLGCIRLAKHKNNWGSNFMIQTYLRVKLWLSWKMKIEVKIK